MPFNIKVGGAWKEGTSAKVKVGGAWKTVESIQVKVGGAWKVAFNNSISPKITATVAPNPSAFAQDVIISGFVLPVPTGGTVLVRDSGDSPIGTEVNVNTSTGFYTITIPDQAVGTYNFSVNYSGFGVYQPDSTDVTVSVGTIPTTTTLTRSAASYVYNEPRVTLSGTVTPVPLSGGSVTISNLSQGTIGVADVSAINGSYSLLAPVRDVGSYTGISAFYGGSGNYSFSTSGTVSYSVTQAAVSLSASRSSASVQVGNTVTLSAVMSTGISSPGPLSFRSVTFQGLNASSIWVNLGTGTTNTSGTATFTWTAVAGITQIRAVYAGETNYSGQTSAGVAITVTTAVATTLTSSVSNSTPLAGTNTTLSGTLTITSSGSAISGRSLTFQGLSGGTWFNLGTGNTNASGVASFTWTAVAGYTQIRTVYAGEADYLASTSAGVGITVLTNISTSTSIGRSAASYTYNGTRVTISGTVSPTPSGGTVKITGSIGGAAASDFATDVTVSTTDGSYSVVMPIQNAGSYTDVTAIYSGSGLYLASTSGTTSYTVNKASTTITAPGNATVNSGTSITSTVNLKTGTTNFASQSISFESSTDGTNWSSVGSANTDSNGNASLSWTPASDVTDVRAKYAGTTNYNAATSTAGTIKVRTLKTATFTPAGLAKNDFKFFGFNVDQAEAVASRFTMPTHTGAVNMVITALTVEVSGTDGETANVRLTLWEYTNAAGDYTGNFLGAAPAISPRSRSRGQANIEAQTSTFTTPISVTPGRQYMAGFWRNDSSSAYTTQFSFDNNTGTEVYYDNNMPSPNDFVRDETLASTGSLIFSVNYQYYS